MLGYRKCKNSPKPTHALRTSTMVVKRATNALKRAAKVSMKQAVLMAFMATMPPMWLTYTVRFHFPNLARELR